MSRRRRADGRRRRRRGESRAGRAADRPRRRRRARGSSCCPSISAFSARGRPTSWPCARADGAGAQQAFLARLARARTASGWSAARCRSRAAIPARVRSACLVYGPDGQRVARYDKIHLFAFARGDERYDEGRTIEPGTGVVAVRRCRAAASACRSATTCAFRSSIARMGELALILVPAAFTATTGAAHWHLLLRARAVENQCYVLAAAQGGLHPERPAHVRPFAADRSVGRDRRRARRGSRASSSATSIRRASPKCARSCRRSRTACSVDADSGVRESPRWAHGQRAGGSCGAAHLPRSRISTAPPPPACCGASQ